MTTKPSSESSWCVGDVVDLVTETVRLLVLPVAFLCLLSLLFWLFG